MREDLKTVDPAAQALLVRTGPTIRRRIALDMQRDLQAPARRQTIITLHQQRCKTG